MFFKFKKTINTIIFNYFNKGILSSPPVLIDERASCVIVSQLYKSDLFMYLAAIKSFTKYITPKKVVVVSDRLSENDISILKSQIEDLVVIDINDVDCDGFPNKGTWERLLTIYNLSNSDYVIQLDADTLTLNNIPEVVDAITENRSFALCTFLGQKFISFKGASQLVANHSDDKHIQIQAELAFEKINNADNLKYIRGCSGFAGFAKGSCNKDFMKDISDAVEKEIGRSKWHEWGSEQVASNITIANSNNPVALPISKYNYFSPGINMSNFSFLHFIGEFRFYRHQYTRLARSIAKSVK